MPFGTTINLGWTSKDYELRCGHVTVYARTRVCVMIPVGDTTSLNDLQVYGNFFLLLYTITVISEIVKEYTKNNEKLHHMEGQIMRTVLSLIQIFKIYVRKKTVYIMYGDKDLYYVTHFLHTNNSCEHTYNFYYNVSDH